MYLVHEAIARQYSPGAAGESAQDVELMGVQATFFTRYQDFACASVYLQVGKEPDIGLC